MSTVSSGLGDMLRRIFGGSPQRVVRERVGKTPFPETAPIQQAPPAEAKAAYRVGFNPKQKGRIDPTTGERFLTGSFPTPAGIAAALARVPSSRVEVRIYGTPSWDTRENTSPPPDKLGNVYVTYFAPKSELLEELAALRGIEDWVSTTGSWDFERVLAVYVG